MIPKVIHYIWLSEDKMDRVAKYCIRSWHRKAPGYTIKRWSMKDFNMDEMPSYVKDAVKNRKWAFACDYLRLYVLEKYGGFYLDSDVIMERSPDEFLDNGFVSSVEYYSDLFEQDKAFVDDKGNASKPMICGMALQAAVMGSEAHHPFLKDCLEYYEHKPFDIKALERSDEMLAPHTYAYIAVKYGFKYINKEQKLSENMHLYPSEVFAPGLWNATENSVMIHMCNGSWRDISLRDRWVINLSKFAVLCRFRLKH